MLTQRVKRSLLTSCICLIWISLFGFTNGDRVVIYMTRNNTNYYLSSNASGAVVSRTKNSLDLYSMWEVIEESNSERTYLLKNAGNGRFLNYNTRGGGNDYPLTAEDGAAALWTIANAASNASTMTNIVNGNTRYVRCTGEAVWRLGTYSYTLNFVVLHSSTVSDVIYSGLEAEVTGVNGISANSQDLLCNTTSSYFDINYKMQKRGRVWTNGDIAIEDYQSTYSDESLSLNAIRALGFTFAVDLSSADATVGLSCTENQHGFHFIATNNDITGTSDKIYPITCTANYTGTSDMPGGEVTTGFSTTEDLSFKHLGYRVETITSTKIDHFTPEASKESLTIGRNIGATNQLSISATARYWQDGAYLIYYNNTLQESCSSTPNELTLGTLQGANISGYTIVLADGSRCPWCHVLEVKSNGEIVVESTQANNFNDARTAYLNIALDVTNNGEHISGTISIPIYQLGMASGTGSKFLHYEGYSNAPGDFNENGTQKTHEYEITLYMIPNKTTSLIVKERDFRGWVRWYDYDSGCSVGAIDGTTWATAPNTNFVTIPIGATGADTRGVAKYNSRNNGSDPVLNTPTAYATKPHNIACDLSNYLDGTWSTAAGSTIIEPTLSYRCIFHLRPAYEMDSMMRATQNTLNAVEEYKVIMPMGVANILPTTWLYMKGKGDNTQKCYIYNDRGTYRRVGDSNDNQAKTANWYIYANGTYTSANTDGTANERGFQLKPHNTEETKTYVLRTGTGANDYTLAKYIVTFKKVSEVGPSATTIISAEDIEQNFNVLSMLNFNYDTPGTTSYSQYYKPLKWEEATTGFAYSMSLGIPINRGHNIEGGGFPYYGEYCFANKTANTYWYVIENRGGAANGYMMYVDGTELPGKICTLGTDAYLCAGEKIFCSAWVANVHTDVNSVKPILKFVIEGYRKDEGKWHEVSQYMTGEIANSQYWKQVNFEVVLDQQYDEFRIAVYNFGNGNSGNDFVIDDICIYSMTPPLMAYQTTSVCPESDELMQLVFRIDCFSEANQEYLGEKMWYDVVTVNEHGDTIPVLSASEIQLPANEASVVAQWHDVKIDDFLHGRYQYDENNEQKSEVVGFIKEKVGRDERYVMYIVRNLNMKSGRYTMRISMGTGDEPAFSSECAMNNTFAITESIRLDIAGKNQDGSDSEDLCGNSFYYIAPDIAKLEMDGSGNVNKRNGYCYCDWLVNIDTTNNFANCKTQTGYEYNDIINALTNDLRIPYFSLSESTINKNINVSNLTEIDKAYMQNNGEHYDMIVDLVEKGFLILYKIGINVYMPGESPNRNYIAIPIYGTGRYSDTDEEMDLCLDPIIFTIGVRHHGEVVILGPAAPEDMPEHLRYSIPNARYNAEEVQTGIDMPIQTLEGLVFGDTATIIASSDPAFNEQSWCAFMPEKIYQLTGDHSDYYHEGDLLSLRRLSDSDLPAGKTSLVLQEGYTYTLEIPMRSVLGETMIHYVDKDCPIGSAYINIIVVPSYEMWAPGKTDDNTWANDDNWVMIDPTTWQPVTTKQRGFVPMAHTSAIIDNVGDTTSYPIISNYTLEDVINRYTDFHNPDHKVYPDSIKGMDIYYDYRFRGNTCKDIAFRKNAMLLNQDWLEYEKASVSMNLPTGEWTVVSPSLAGVVSGDIYINRDGDLSGSPFDVPNYTGTRSRNDDYAFWMSLYNSETYRLTSSSTHTIRNASWGELSNFIGERFTVGSGIALLGFPPDSKAYEEDLGIRLPKQETEYHYYRNGETVSSLPAERVTRDSDYGKLAFAPTDGRNMELNLKNEVSANHLFLFGNPTMAYINMHAFLEQNHLPILFYYFDENAWQVASIYSALTAQPVQRIDFESDAFYLPPMRAVLIPTPDNEDLTEMSVHLNSSMLAVQGWNKKANKDLGLHAQKRIIEKAHTATDAAVLNIYASNDFGRSHLIIGENADASDGYSFPEDIELLTTNLDGEYNYQTQDMPITPTNVYTVAGDKALSVAINNTLTTMPVLFTVDPYLHTPTIHLLIDGVHHFDGNLYFIDTKTGDEALLLNGIQMDIETPKDGEMRYFITLRKEQKNESSLMPESAKYDNNNVQIISYNSGEITIIASSQILNVYAYDTSGRLMLAQSNVNSNIHTAFLPQGIALINIVTEKGAIAKKVIIR